MNRDKIIITGSEGYIGKLLALYLGVEKSDGYDILSGRDLTNTDVQEMAVKGADVVVHLAGISGIGLCEQNQILANMVNRDMAINLAMLAKERGCRHFIFASSSAVYGEASEYDIHEEGSVNPRNVYGKTKLDAERGILELADKDFRVTVLRKSNVFGYGLDWKGITVIDKFLEFFLKKESINIPNSGIQKRDFVHISDVVRIYAQIARSQRSRSGVYNIGSGRSVSIRSLAKQINDIGHQILGYRVPVEINESITDGGWHDFEYSTKRALMEFQFKARTDIDFYIRERMMIALRELKV